jgi:hypothetical protein
MHHDVRVCSLVHGELIAVLLVCHQREPATQPAARLWNGRPAVAPESGQLATVNAMVEREPRAGKRTRTESGSLASTSATPIPTRRPTSFSGSLLQVVRWGRDRRRSFRRHAHVGIEHLAESVAAECGVPEPDSATVTRRSRPTARSSSPARPEGRPGERSHGLARSQAKQARRRLQRDGGRPPTRVRDLQCGLELSGAQTKCLGRQR